MFVFLYGFLLPENKHGIINVKFCFLNRLGFNFQILNWRHILWKCISVKMRMLHQKWFYPIVDSNPITFSCLVGNKSQKESQFHGSNLVLPEICYCYHHRRLIEILQDPPISKSTDSLTFAHKRMASLWNLWIEFEKMIYFLIQIGYRLQRSNDLKYIDNFQEKIELKVL